MKSIITVIFLVFAVLVGFSYFDKYLGNDMLSNHQQIVGTDNKTSTTNSTGTTISDPVYVTLTGAVSRQGKYKIECGSYLLEAIEKAGGLKELADSSCVDMYLVVEDDIDIYVPKVSDEDKISINDATLEELTSLTGVGKTIATRIINYRDEIGEYYYLEQIMDVDGIGESLFNKIKDYITL